MMSATSQSASAGAPGGVGALSMATSRFLQALLERALPRVPRQGRADAPEEDDEERAGGEGKERGETVRSVAHMIA